MAELIDLISANFDYQNFFSAKLTSGITASDTDIPMDAIPTASEGVLVIDWDVAASREVIFFNSKTASKVVCPSAVDGRGHDNTTGVSHLSGANVIMAPVRSYFRLAQQLATTSTAAWKPLGYTPSTIVDNGNRSYTMVFNSVDLTSFISNGMRLRGDPATNQPTRCTSLNGTTQYYSKTSPAATTFTDDFVAGAWVKPSSYAANPTFLSRYNGTSGWEIRLSQGLPTVVGYNAGAANYSLVQSIGAVPLNRWSHVAGLLDMSAFTALAATAETAKSWIMVDGLEVPAVVQRGGTNPTALVQAGNINVGASNAANFFAGKIAQAFYSNTRILQANVRLLKNQGITTANCTTYNIVSAYSFDNSIADINTTNANDLTANGSAVATEADSPFGQNDAGTPGSYEWGIVTSRTFATNTTITVQAPEGSAWPTLPTSAMITSMWYSTESVPYGFPRDTGRWVIEYYCYTSATTANLSANTWAVVANILFTIPVGQFKYGYSGFLQESAGGVAGSAAVVCLATAAPAASDYKHPTIASQYDASAQYTGGYVAGEHHTNNTVATVFSAYSAYSQGTATVTNQLRGDISATRLYAIPDYF